MANIGFASLAIIPSMRGISGEISKGLSGIPALGKKAGAELGQGIADGVEAKKAAVEKAADQVAKLRNKEADAAGKVRVAEAQLQALRDKGVADAGRLAAAEERVEKAHRDLTAAQNATAKGSDSLARAQKQVADSADDAGSSVKGFSSALDDVGGSARSSLSDLGKMAVAAAGIGSAMELATSAMDFESVTAKMNASMGASGPLAEEYGKVAGKLWSKGLGESMDDVGMAVTAVQSSFTTLGSEGEVSIEKAAERALNLANIFGIDVNESVQTASQLIVNGLAKDSTQAMDLMATAMQRVPAAMRDELPEIINEYGTNFRALGFSGEQAFALLVNAADKGKWALDKTGDALKEFTIRGADLSKTSTDAFRLIGLDAEQMANKIASGGPAAQQALQQTAQGLLSISNPAERANAAIALFGTPLEDLSVDQIPAFLESLSGSENSMAGFAGSADEAGKILNDTAQAKLSAFGRSVQTNVIEILGTAAGFFDRNRGLLYTLIGALGAAAVAYGVLRAAAVASSVAQGIQAAATGAGTAALGANKIALGAHAVMSTAAAVKTKLWAAAQWILNAALNANPIGLIVLAVAGLVAAIVLAYKNSETFRNIVQAAWNGIKTAVSAVWSWIQTTLWPGLKAVFTGIGTVVMWLWNNVIKPAWAGIKIAIEVAWNIIKGYFTVWMTVIRAVGAVVMWLWNNVMKPAWNGIKILLAVVWAGIKVAINAGMAVFRAIGAVVMWLWNNVMVPAWRGIQRAIEIAKDVIGIVIDAVKNYFQGVADKAEEVKNWLTEKWNAVVDFFKSIPGKISSAAKGMWDGIKDAFKGVINWIIRAWNSLEFTIPSVEIFGKKIGGATLSVPKLQELAQGGQVAGRRRDGLLWGPGTGTSDSILGVDALGAPTALVSAGEFVVNEAATKRWLPLLAAINGGARSLQRLATGGVVKREPYGLPNGTNTGGYGSGGNIFPEWVRKLGQEFSVKPSTYPGHQESDRREPGYAPNPQRLNRGIDWVGTIDAMHKFALHLLGIAPKASGLEQIIWQNPQSGQKVGWAGRTPDTSGSYFAGDYGGHQDHVHIRASEDFTAVAPAEPDPAAVTPADPADPVTPETPTPTTPTAPAQEQKPTIGTTISGIAGKAVEGQVQSLLGVLGIGDSPPVLGAIDEAQRQQNEQQQSPTDPAAVAPADPATPTAPETPKPGRLPGWEGYAFDITEQAKKMNLVKRAAIIGNATALVEAGDPMKMWANRAVPESLKFPHDAVGSDHDSIGLFQQRDNGAWGSVADRMDPHRSAKMFYDALVKIPNWESMDMGAAAQAVQRSAFPGKYAQKIGRATELVDKAKLYDSGGWLPEGLTMTNNKTGDVEPILTRSQWADAHDAITIVKRQIAEQSAPGESVPQVIYNIQTARVEDAFLEARKKEEQRMTARMAGL